MNARCYLCGNLFSGPATAKNPTLKTSVFRCPGCGLLQSVHPGSQFIDDMNAAYRTNWTDNQVEQFRKDSRWRAIEQLKFCTDAINHDDFKFGSVLDFGAGVGGMCEYLTTQFDRVFGVEADERSLELMQKLPNVTALGCTSQIEDRTLDLVVSSHVLEHIPDPILLLATLSEKMKTGALLFIEVPNEGKMVRDVDLNDCAAAINFGHIFHYDTDSLIKVLHKFKSQCASLSLISVAQTGPSIQQWLAERKVDPKFALPGERGWIRVLCRLHRTTG